MTIDNKYTRPSVRFLVVKNIIGKTNSKDFIHPNASELEFQGLNPALAEQELWAVGMGAQIGMDRSDYKVYYFETEKEAVAFHQQCPVGTDFSQREVPRPVDLMKLFANGIPDRNVIIEAGDGPNFDLIYECLYSAGVIEGQNFEISKEVLNWAGADRIAWAKKIAGGNWAILLQLEYCTRHFTRTSLAFMAAHFEFNYYIAKDYYLAGYLMREIEMILGGAETVAEQTLKARKSAGEAGRQASQSAKKKRLAMFMAEIENLRDLAGRMSEQVILDQAFQNAVDQDQALWRQGRGQQAEYEIILRSDPEYRMRYFEIFPQTA